jgi:hypothetical protein
MNDINQPNINRKKELIAKISSHRSAEQILLAIMDLESAEDIVIVSEIENSFYRSCAARHSLAPLETLYKLAKDKDPHVCYFAIVNPFMPLEKLWELSSDYRLFQFILSSPVTSRELLLKILDDTDKLKDEEMQHSIMSTASESRNCPIWLTVSTWSYEDEHDSINSIESGLFRRYLDSGDPVLEDDVHQPRLDEKLYNKYYLDNRSALKQDLKELNDYISTMEDEEEKYLMNKKMKKIVELVNAGFLS